MLFRFDEIPDPWTRCMMKGSALVRHHSELAAYARPGNVQLTIFHIPSFVDATGWTIRKLEKNSGFELQRVVWHQHEDSFRDKEAPDFAGPTISTATAMLDSDWWQERYAMLRDMRIPLIVPCQWVTICDGDTTGLEIGGLQIEWGNESPEGWEMLVEWTKSCMEHFQTLLS
jgi:hypothetical protein